MVENWIGSFAFIQLIPISYYQFICNYIIIIIKMNKQIDKNLQLPSSHPLYNELAWISTKVNYSNAKYSQLQAQNQRILNTLKLIQNKLSSQLQNKRKIGSPNRVQSQNCKALQQKIRNNQKLINALKRDQSLAQQRKSVINDGLESKTIQIKYAIQGNINKLKSQIKQLKQQQHEAVRKLQVVHDPSRPQNHEQHIRMQQQLRVMSIKYVRLLDKYNKSTQKLALVTNVEVPQINIPQQIYDKQLQQRQQVQFKQYQGIVKLCTVLSHRNDSQQNKAHRIYGSKLKQLEKTIMKLGELDQAITSREAELMQSKKNIEIMKIKVTNQASVESRAMRLSQGSIASGNKARSYSTAKLQQVGYTQKSNFIKNEQKQQLNLKNRGYSLSKIKVNAI